MIKTIKKKETQIISQFISKGNRHEFEKIYALYYQSISSYLLNHTSNRSLIEDVVQDTFMVLWDNRETISVNISLKSYLYGIAFNKLMQNYRKSARRNDMLTSYYHSTLNDIIFNMDDDDTFKSERLKKLNNCIERLPNRCKEVFTAKKIKGLKPKDISEKLDISIKTIEGHITKAYILIRKCMYA